MPEAVLLIAHGSRRDDANADLVHVAQAVRERLPDRIVEIAYLELGSPLIPAGLERCLAAGAGEIRMVPYFLSPGSHVVTDLSACRDAFAAEHPDVKVSLSPPLGRHPLMIEIVLERLHETM